MAARVSAEYRDRLSRAESSEEEAAHRHAVTEMERTIVGQALAAERSTYFRLARERKISDALARRLVSEVDQREIRMTSAAGH